MSYKCRRVKKKSIFIAAARKKNAEKNRRFIFEIHMRKRKNHQFQYHNMYPPHDLMTVLKKNDIYQSRWLYFFK